MKPKLITNFPSFFGGSLSKELFKDADFFLGDLFPTRSWPPANVSQNEKGYTVELSAPGYGKKDVEIAVEDDTLTISFEKKENKTDYLSKEFSYSFSKRSFTLPEGVDKENIKTAMENGILKIEIPNRVEVPKKPERKLIPIE